VLRASFLVERKRVPEFDKAMNEVARHEDGRIRFKYVGPLAPHSFVTVPWAS
jgi:Gas vesicle synthesis protein GvpL/GvpF